MNFSNEIEFKKWILNELSTPSIEPKFLSNAVPRLRELERSLRLAAPVIKKAIKIEHDFRGRDRLISDLWQSIPLQRKQFTQQGYERPYSQELENLISYKPTSFGELTRFINYILDGHGTRDQSDWASSNRFPYNYEKVMGKEYSDGSGGSLIDNIIGEIRDSNKDFDKGRHSFEDVYGYSYSNAMEVMKKTKEIFRNMAKYISEITKIEKHLKAVIDDRNRKEQKYYSWSNSGDVPPAHKPVEVLYHATPFVKEIQSTGFKVGEKKALGGATSGGISFTADFAIAKEIVRNLREVIAIAKNQKGPEDVIRMAKANGVDITKASYYDTYMRQKQLDSMNIPRKQEIYAQDRHMAFEMFRYYVAMSPHRYDPLFFGVGVEDFEQFDPRNVGVFAAKVDMSKIIEYLSSMEEFRIPPDAILSYRLIPT